MVPKTPRRLPTWSKGDHHCPSCCQRTTQHRVAHSNVTTKIQPVGQDGARIVEQEIVFCLRCHSQLFKCKKMTDDPLSLPAYYQMGKSVTRLCFRDSPCFLPHVKNRLSLTTFRFVSEANKLPCGELTAWTFFSAILSLASCSTFFRASASACSSSTFLVNCAFSCSF